MRFEFGCVDTAPGSGMIDRVMQVEHFVKHHVLERKLWSVGIVKDTADHDHVVRRIEMAKSRPRAYMAPSQFGSGHHPSKVLAIQIFEDGLEIVNRAPRSQMILVPALLADLMNPAPHVTAVQIEPVAMLILASDGFPIELTEQNVSKCFRYGSRCAIQQIRNARDDTAALQPNLAISVGKGFIFDLDVWKRRAWADFAMHAPKNIGGRLEEECASQIHGRTRLPGE